MTHETFEAKLLDLAYGELTPREDRKVEAHAAGCETCRAELARLRETRALLSALPAEPAPARGEEILRAAAREVARRREPPARALPPWLWSGAVLAVAIAAVGAVSYRLLAMRPGPLGREERDVLLGHAPELSAPPAAAPPPAASGERAEKRRADSAGERAEAAAPAREEPGADRAGTTGAAPAPAPAPARRQAAPSRKAAPEAFAAAPPPEPERTPSPPAARAERSAEAEGAAAPRAQPPAADAAAAPAERWAQPPPELSAERAAPAAPSASAAPRAAAPSSPTPGAAPSRSRAAAAPRAAGASGREAAAPTDPVARYAALRGAGALRGEVHAIPGCAGESFRKVERDADGRVVKYTRRGEVGGERFEAELFYGEDGALAAARFREGDGAWREARLPRDAGAGLPPAAVDPGRAEEVDGPPRCGR